MKDYISVQRKTAVTAYLESKQLLLFAFACQYRHAKANNSNFSFEK